jgi:uncharacterized protein YqgC (DUF456 family)
MTAWWLTLTFQVVILLAMLLSWFGTVIPIFPGPTVMWALALLYGLVRGFGTRGAIIFGIISLLTVASWLADNVFTIKGAREGGAAWPSVAIASVVGVVSSLFLTPIIGVLLTLFVLYVFEVQRQGDHEKALQATKRMLLGWGWATVARLALGLANLALWSAWAWL